GARCVLEVRHLFRRPGVRPPPRRRHGLRRFLERADGWHRVQERDVEESRLIILFGRETTMTGRSASLTRRPEWATLQEHYQKIKEVHLRQLFADDPKRG